MRGEQEGKRTIENSTNGNNWEGGSEGGREGGRKGGG